MNVRNNNIHLRNFLNNSHSSQSIGSSGSSLSRQSSNSSQGGYFPNIQIPPINRHFPKAHKNNSNENASKRMPAALTSLTYNEMRLYKMLMHYRAQHGLPSIPLSKCLTYVSKVHCVDQQISSPAGRCNLHSWSNLGPWTSCCYTSDHKKAKYMWSKPRELTPYKGHGFEIATYTSHIMTPEVAFELWKTSPPHNDLILNKGVWAGKQFKAIGVGISRNYSNCWFGLEPDNH